MSATSPIPFLLYLFHSTLPTQATAFRTVYHTCFVFSIFFAENNKADHTP